MYHSLSIQLKGAIVYVVLLPQMFSSSKKPEKSERKIKIMINTWNFIATLLLVIRIIVEMGNQECKRHKNISYHRE